MFAHVSQAFSTSTVGLLIRKIYNTFQLITFSAQTTVKNHQNFLTFCQRSSNMSTPSWTFLRQRSISPEKIHHEITTTRNNNSDNPLQLKSEEEDCN